ncbi:MAG: ATPase component of Mn/Zn ABC-type transporter [Clostridia bacterium]|jgi:zinc transport system ATP-binding protein|nr:ATPase component of Mn/Zn ABC-type transporter [Clostridia bacterium]
MIQEKCDSINCRECGSSFCCTKIKHISVKHGSNQILKDVNLHIHCGELTAIIGVNGAGKSTLLKALLGEIPHLGEIVYLETKNKVTKTPIIGYVPQKLDFDLSSPMSVLDVFAAAKSKKPIWWGTPKKVRERAKASLAKVEAEQLIDRQLGVLSGGELQRVLLALALNPIPNILLLDEPVSGIDHKGLKLFYQTVADIRKTYDLSIILVSHDLHLVAHYADRVALLNNGTIEICGTPQEVFASHEVNALFNMGSYERVKEGE